MGDSKDMYGFKRIRKFVICTKLVRKAVFKIKQRPLIPSEYHPPEQLPWKQLLQIKILCATRFEYNFRNNSTFLILGTPSYLIDVDQVLQRRCSTLSNRGVAMDNPRDVTE